MVPSARRRHQRRRPRGSFVSRERGQDRVRLLLLTQPPLFVEGGSEVACPLGGRSWTQGVRETCPSGPRQRRGGRGRACLSRSSRAPGSRGVKSETRRRSAPQGAASTVWPSTTRGQMRSPTAKFAVRPSHVWDPTAIVHGQRHTATAVTSSKLQARGPRFKETRRDRRPSACGPCGRPKGAAGPAAGSLPHVGCDALSKHTADTGLSERHLATTVSHNTPPKGVTRLRERKSLLRLRGGAQ